MQHQWNTHAPEQCLFIHSILSKSMCITTEENCKFASFNFKGKYAYPIVTYNVLLPNEANAYHSPVCDPTLTRSVITKLKENNNLLAKVLVRIACRQPKSESFGKAVLRSVPVSEACAVPLPAMQAATLHVNHLVE
jgi:hypothetical protein